MKKITGYVKLQLPAGKANPSPPVGPALGQHGVNIMEFCKQFNARTQAQAKDDVTIPVEITRELEKVTWPTRKETSAATVVVLVTVLISALVLSGFDAIWAFFTNWFLR